MRSVRYADATHVLDWDGDERAALAGRRRSKAAVGTLSPFTAGVATVAAGAWLALFSLSCLLWWYSDASGLMRSVALRTLPGNLSSSSSSSPPAALRPSLNHCRLLSLLERVQSGSPIRVAAIGGSITKHVFASTGYAEMLVRRLSVKWPPRNTTASAVHSDVDARRRAFHVSEWNSSLHSHALSNRAMAACPSSFTSTCMSTLFAHADLGMVDLLLAEFAVNDETFQSADSSRSKAISVWLAMNDGAGWSTSGAMGEFDPATNMERIIRYALSLSVGSKYGDVEPNYAIDGPAVLLVQFCFQSGLSAAALHEPVAYYYGVPVIDICELFPNTYISDATAQRFGQPRWLNFHTDDTHSNEAGHSIAAAMISERLGSLARTAQDPAEQAACQIHRVHPSHARVSPPLNSINRDSTDWRCTWGSFRPGNFGEGGALDHQQSLTFLNFSVALNQGWTYADETKKGKWGWQSLTVNATIAFRLQPSSTRLVISYLRTASNIGSVDVWLTAEPGGLVSSRHRVDAWWASTASTFELTSLPSTLMPSARPLTALTLYMQLVDVGHPVAEPPTKQPANKFKLVAFMEY